MPDDMLHELGKQTRSLEGIGQLLGRHSEQYTTIDQDLQKQTEVLGEVDSKLGTQTRKLGGIEVKIGEQTAKLGDINVELGQHTVKLNNINVSLGAQTGKLGEIDVTLQAQTGKLGSIDVKLGAQSGKLDDIAVKLGGQTEKLSDINVVLGEHSSSLGEIDVRLNQNMPKIVDSLAQLAQGISQPTATQTHIVNGVVRREDGLPAAGVQVLASHLTERGAVRLGEDQADTQGRYTIRYEQLPGAAIVNLSVAIIGRDERTLVASDIIKNAGAAETINLTLPLKKSPETERSLVGRVMLDDGRLAENLTLRLYRRDFGGKDTLLQETTTLSGGSYAFTFTPGRINANLRIVAIDPSTQKEETLPAQLNYLGDRLHVTRNLVAPAKMAARETEYSRMGTALQPLVNEMIDLSAVEETADRQDITALNRATGWDARLLALSALAARLSVRLKVDEDVDLSHEGLYGLLRAGFPSNKVLLAQVSPDAASATLKAVRDAGIIGLNDGEIETFTKDFKQFSTKVRLSLPVPGGNASYDEMLNIANLSKEKKEKFADVYLKHGINGRELWTRAHEQGLSDKEIAKLQFQGKLAFLTGSSHEMTAMLMQKENGGVANPVKLVDQGLYTADQWQAELEALAESSGKTVDALIPSAYVGAPEQRLKTYTEDMARKLRLSYPTQVLAHQIQNDAQDAFQLGDAQAVTATLLRNAAGQGFRLGLTPIESFFSSYPGAATGLTAEEFHAAKAAIKDLQCTYQISTSDSVMMKMRQNGLKTANDVTSMSIASFFDYYGHLFSSPNEAKLVYRKAEQVSSMVYNLFTMANQVESDVTVYAMAAPADVQQSVKNELIKHYPTLETLFGSMDFCECEHCRSVLSPAAYLVDLLQFVEGEDAARAGFEANWKKSHGGKSYTSQYMLPYDALIERRPDLPHIPLTCENTHTALPYIDVVNEILEYYVANGALSPAAARDTGDATTDELLVEPQNVIREAYEAVRQARYPLILPFDLWLETVREFANYFETPLADILETFRPTDELFAPAESYDRASVFIESLGLSPAEYGLFTDPEPLAGGKWYKLYGYATDGPTITKPTNVGNATLTLPNDNLSFAAGNPVTYRDVSADGVQGEVQTISNVGAANSGGAGRTLITLEGEWTTPPEAGDQLIAAAPALLSSAKTLSHRLDVTYKELIEIVKTGFVNPKLAALVVLYKLGVTVADVFFYDKHKTFYEHNKDLLGKDRKKLSAADKIRYDKLIDEVPDTRLKGWEVLGQVQAFVDRLSTASTEYAPFDAANWVNNALANNEFDDVLVLADPDAGCSFDATTLRYADGRIADDIVFLRINLFVRLWRKLGWSIEETDRALCTFIPQTAPFDTVKLNKQPLKTALIYLAHLDAIEKNVSVGKDSRLKLLTLWSDIATTGKKSLYAQLFLTSSMLRSDPVFDDPLGQYLSDPNIDLKFHLPALQGALGLTADEIKRIIADAGKDLNPDNPMTLDTAKLTLTNVSILYRYGLLAKGLKMSVRDIIALKGLSGLNPFASLRPDPLETLDEDKPFSQTLRFIEVANMVKESEFSVEDLEYLLRDRFDPTGKYRPDVAGTMLVLKRIAEGISTIQADHAVLDDPTALTEDLLRQKLGLALTPDAVERFLAMMKGTAEFTATWPNVEPAYVLSIETFADEERIRDLTYKEVPNKEQKLTFCGVLFETQENELKAKYDAVLNNQQKETFAELLASVKQLARDFFESQLKKQPLRAEGEAGFLEEGDFETLFTPLKSLKKILPEDTDQEIVDKLAENVKIASENEKALQQRRSHIAQAFLPYLQRRLVRQFVVQMLTDQTDADPDLVENFVVDERLLPGTESLLATFTETAVRGVDAEFFEADDLTGVAQASRPIIANVDTRLKDKQDKNDNPLVPAGSARFKGYLEVPSAGAYRFYIMLDKQNAAAELRFDHLPEPLFLRGTAAKDNDVFGDNPGEYLELEPGILYSFSLELKQLGGGDAKLLVQGETLPKGQLELLSLYSFKTIQKAEQTLKLLNKVLQLLQNLGLSQTEVRYLLILGGVDLSKLPVQEEDDTPGNAQSLFAHFLHLAAYWRLKRDLADRTNDLIAVFEANGSGGAAAAYPLIAQLARRDEATVKETAETLWGTPDFTNEESLERLWAALQIVERLGVPVASLHEWTKIVDAATVPEDRFAIARDLRGCIKARFKAEAWQGVAKTIFDRLRKRQRDALVAHVLHTRGFERLEQLYEYFLIDPGMEPVVQTSRIRLAISSVQLFIQRCLLNLEVKVHPSAIVNAEFWEWMKRYRVWEANRKIFLFPENWLEPEFRDDKSHLYTELEGALLQGDVSRDLMEDAFLNYLRKLDELARLDIVAMHLEQRDDPGQNVLHVFGRTFAEPFKYFYRRFASGMWTPWELVTVEIQGNHLAPVIWRDRLYLFWVTFMEKAVPETESINIDYQTKQTIPAAPKTYLEAQLHWSEYLQGIWRTGESSGFDTQSVVEIDDMKLTEVDTIFIHVSKQYDGDGEERGVYVHLKVPGRRNETIGKTNTGVRELQESPELNLMLSDVKKATSRKFRNGQTAFHLAGRNSRPNKAYAQHPPVNPYLSTNEANSTRYASDKAPLSVHFTQVNTTEPGKAPVEIWESILLLINKHSLLPCNNRLTLELPKNAYEGAAKPDEVKQLLESNLAETESLIKPVFYQDELNTFFIEPQVIERTIEEWETWLPPTPPSDQYEGPEWSDWLDQHILPHIPDLVEIPVPIPDVVDPMYGLEKIDWLINPGTVIYFDDQLIGAMGQVPLTIEQATPETTTDGYQVQLNAASSVGVAKIAVLRNAMTLEQVGMVEPSGGIQVVGTSGVNQGLKNNVDQLAKNGFGANVANVVGW